MHIRYSCVSTDKLTLVFGLMTWWHSDRKITISMLDPHIHCQLIWNLKIFSFLGEEI
jgi:hypothetical protein